MDQRQKNDVSHPSKAASKSESESKKPAELAGFLVTGGCHQR